MMRVVVALSVLAVLLPCCLALSSCGTYTVASGDTLNGIAAKYGNTFTGQDMCTLNGLSDCNNIDIGQVLQVPCATTGTTCATYTVKSGDTINTIAAQYGISGSQLCSYNNLSNCNNIDIGQQLKIPCASSTTSATHATSTTGSATTGASSTTGSGSSWPNGPLKAMYNIDGGQQSDIQQMADAGYNYVLLAFFVSNQAKYASQVWQGLGSTVQKNTVNYLHSKNCKIVVSAGGAEDEPYTSITGTNYGTAVANFAKNNNLDGVDFDLENFGGSFTFGGMSTTQTVQWVADATNAARNILGASAIISHAPQPPYFGANNGFSDGYTKAYKLAPSINYLLVQYYNNGNLNTFSEIFTSANGGAVTQIAAGGIPLSKIVVGKPVDSDDADSEGYNTASSLHTIFSQAQSQYGWNSGVMGWVWHDATTNGNWIKTIYP